MTKLISCEKKKRESRKTLGFLRISFDSSITCQEGATCRRCRFGTRMGKEVRKERRVEENGIKQQGTIIGESGREGRVKK